MAVALRIDPELHAKLSEVAKATRSSLSQALSAAVDAYRREIMIAAMNADYAAVRADPDAWAAEERERALWDRTNLDGLEGESSRTPEPAKVRRRYSAKSKRR